jgi:presenilin-like A22 family membrane protease
MSNEPKNNKKTDAINGSFTLSESPDEKLQGTFEIINKSEHWFYKVIKNIFTLKVIAYFLAFFAIFSGVYGFFFQKGMPIKNGP